MRVRPLLLAVLVLALLPGAAAADYAHVVQRGETLTSVAAADGLSIAALARANGISAQAQLIAGQTLRIPPRTAATAAHGTADVTPARPQVQDSDSDGDNDGTATTTTATTTTTNPSPSQAATQTTPTAATSTSTASPVPTPERVNSAEIAAVANANGVPASLAEAVAWQESGWNNDEVSSVGAVGVMQIVPKTWRWIDAYLTPGKPLGTASAAENLRAGALLLRQLLSLTGGDEQLTAAGYFQGLASVRRFGMFASTRQYVADVMALSSRFGS